MATSASRGGSTWLRLGCGSLHCN